MPNGAAIVELCRYLYNFVEPVCRTGQIEDKTKEVEEEEEKIRKVEIEKAGGYALQFLIELSNCRSAVVM